MGSGSLIDRYPQIFKRISLDEIDIIARGETPRHRLYILLEDVPSIIDVIRTKGEEEAVKFIASKIRQDKSGE